MHESLHIKQQLTLPVHAHSVIVSLPVHTLVVQAILHRQLVYPGHLSSDAVSFLSTALTRDPRTRPTVKELLQHPFISMHTSNQ
jgi:serine/threonine protein kinase